MTTRKQTSGSLSVVGIATVLCHSEEQSDEESCAARPDLAADEIPRSPRSLALCVTIRVKYGCSVNG